MSSRQFQPVWLAVLCCLFATQIASAQQFTAAERGRNAPSSFYGIMGDVERPGVYAYPDDRLPLTTLVERAGGLTRQASGNLRIIRQGRGGQQTFYTLTSRYEVLSGDLIVVDARRRGSGTFNSQLLPASISRTERPTGVQIGLVNLLSRPIVLIVPPQEATLWNITKRLNQISPPQRVTLLAAGASPKIHEAIPSDDINLTSNSVLVLNPETIQYNRLPEFPNPIDGTRPHIDVPDTALQTERITTSTQAGQEGGIQPGVPATLDRGSQLLVAPVAATVRTPHSPENSLTTPAFPGQPDQGFGHSRPLQQLPHNTPEESPEGSEEYLPPPVLHAPTFPNVAVNTSPQANLSEHSQSVVAMTSTNRGSLASPDHSPEIARNDVGQTRQIEGLRQVPPPPPETPAMSVTKMGGTHQFTPSSSARDGIRRDNDGRIALIPRRSPVIVDSPETTTGMGTVSMLFVVGSIGFLSIFAGLHWYVRQNVESIVSNVILASDPLDSIIQNRLSVVEEPVPFPSKMLFQAKPAARRSFRLDNPHVSLPVNSAVELADSVRPQVRKPHFSSSAVETENLDVTEAVSHTEPNRSPEGEPGPTTPTSPSGASNEPTVGRVSVEPVIFGEGAARTRKSRYAPPHPPLETVLPRPHFLNRAHKPIEPTISKPVQKADQLLSPPPKVPEPPVTQGLLDRILTNVKERE